MWSSHAVAPLACAGPSRDLMSWRNVVAFSLTWLVCLAEAANANCAMNTTGVNFGPYAVPVQRNDVLSSGTVTLACDVNSVGLGYKMKLTSNAYMTNGRDQLFYTLYSDSGRVIPWSSSFEAQGVTSANTVVTIYGKIPVNQSTISPGAYSDLVTVHVVF